MSHRSHKKFSPKTITALTPSAVAGAYKFPTGLDLSKRSVAILELGGAFQLSDVMAYCKREGYKMPQISTYFVDGALGASDPQGADGEVCLDIDVIAAVAQGCHIKVVFAPNSDQGFIDGLQKCVDLDPDAISVSWGSPEDSWTPESRSALDAIMQKAANEKGIAVFCASGDNGSSDGQTLGSHCDYPASSPYAIACGGTKLELNPDGSRLNETAWSSTAIDVGGNELGNSEGSGGGISKEYPTTPDWQVGLPDTTPGRHSPDVSGNADPSSGYLVDIDGTIQQIGGTSAVAPLYAALQAIANESQGKHVGNLHTKLYLAAHSPVFYDVTQGTNGHYKAGPGYDCVTGLGVIDGAAWVDYLSNMAPKSPAPSDGTIPSSEAVKAFQGACKAHAGVDIDYEWTVRFLSAPNHPELKSSAVDMSWWTTAMQVAHIICDISKIVCPVVDQLPPTIK